MTSPNGENSLNWVTLWFVCFCYRISIEPLLLLLSLILVLSSWAYIFWSVQCDMIWRNFPLGQTFEPFVLNLTWQKNMSTIRQMLTVVSSRIMKKYSCHLVTLVHFNLSLKFLDRKTFAVTRDQSLGGLMISAFIPFA